MKCTMCKRKEKKEWIEVSPGHLRLINTCCIEVRSRMGKVSFALHKYKEPVAFGYDKKTGRPLAIDKRGKKFDPKDTRYDLNRDPHGWKATDKVPTKKTYHI